ncbi:hypothetical protein RSAG8_07592, partial [Rhizoctonia solani AG-8 WAC10335]
MPIYIDFHYTSGFVVTGFEVTETARHLGYPKVCWMIPTKWDRIHHDIDPETHENTQKARAAVVATGIPEQCLARFEKFPNKEYPLMVINLFLTACGLPRLPPRAGSLTMLCRLAGIW